MKKIQTTPPLPEALSVQDFSKLGFIYITVLGLAEQIVPHTGSWRPWATAANYLVRIALIVYMAFQAQPASPVGVQLDTNMSCDTNYGNFFASIRKFVLCFTGCHGYQVLTNVFILKGICSLGLRGFNPKNCGQLAPWFSGLAACRQS
ncbi:hypothetical protein DSO57_1014586 [Entomophthora muscae]|uniref:Uncharacterized protein n=1 Tax=Entomophthora muscae TaxID=34485 RepID=A0ACC2TFW9_9FUNG|nr:hypothetical protein DSO57_1014586 [Entomophthora muscae]